MVYRSLKSSKFLKSPTDRSLETLHISVAKQCLFWWWIEKQLLWDGVSLYVLSQSLLITLKDLSCSLLILLLLFQLRNIQVKEQYLNCDSIKDLKIILLFPADKKLRISNYYTKISNRMFPRATYWLAN